VVVPAVNQVSRVVVGEPGLPQALEVVGHRRNDLSGVGQHFEPGDELRRVHRRQVVDDDLVRTLGGVLDEQTVEGILVFSVDPLTAVGDDHALDLRVVAGLVSVVASVASRAVQRLPLARPGTLRTHGLVAHSAVRHQL